MTDAPVVCDYLPTCKEAGEGPALVFLHGLGGNRHSFDAQIGALKHRFRCIAWDVPGYGGSAPIDEMTFDSLSASLANLLEHLDVDAPYAVLGHSLGGMVAQAWLARGGACQRLILAQTTASFGKPGSRFNDEFLAARLAPLDDGQTPADFAGTLIASMIHDKQNHATIEAGIATMAPLPADVYRQAIGALVTFDERANLANVGVPTLCLAAEHDTTVPAKAVFALAAQIEGARYECLPNAGHLAYIETPDAFTRAVAEFLA